jgi:hypothetical protein
MLGNLTHNVNDDPTLTPKALSKRQAQIEDVLILQQVFSNRVLVFFYQVYGNLVA